MAREDGTAAQAGQALLTALADAPDAVAAATRLTARAHPRFLAKVGGERHLARLLANAAYAPLVGHEEAQAEAPQELANTARIAFRVRTSDGADAPFLLQLLRDASEDWRVTGLVRRELEHL